jgi:hypothetical protein
MKRFRAAKRLDALDVKVDALEAERRSLEIQALGAEISAGERRRRYFSITDRDLRRKAIGLERRLDELREQDRAAAIEYWTTVSAETRAKLDDLKSDSPTSEWRRSIWWDALTLLWILGGAGWLAAGVAGAATGTVATAIGAWYITRSRKLARPARIREGEDALRASESELRAAQQATPDPVFSASEADTGMPDAAG